MNAEISDLVSEFTGKLVSLVEAETLGRVTQILRSAFPEAALTAGPGWKPFRTVKPGVVAVLKTFPKTGKPSRARVLCPVPGCNGVAAPIFGMVCKEHKGVPKAKIAKYRLDRKKLAVKTKLNAIYGAAAESADAPVKKRKSRAPVLCPVPRCKGVAAPVFGMVCKKHKDVSKSEILKYRKQKAAAKKPVAKKTVKSVAKKTVKPVAKKTAKSVAKKTAKLVVKKTAKLVAKKTAKPVVKKTAKSVAKKTAKPVAKKTAKPVAKKAAKPEAKKAAKPEAKKAAKPEAKKATKPEAKKAVKPEVKKAVKPEAKNVVKSEAKEGIFGKADKVDVVQTSPAGVE